jgi:DNA adenine methylase
MKETTHLHPVVKWTGGKYKIFKQYFEFFPKPILKYIEPFCGSCSILLQLCNHGFLTTDSEIFISDTNSDLIQFYVDVKCKCEDLILKIAEIWNRDFNEIRREYNSGDKSPLFKSSRFYFLVKKCFNGLYRVNSKGEFNTPRGRTSSGNEILFDDSSKNDLRSLSVFFQSFRVDISCRDYREHDYSGDRSTTFAYFDPPYPKISKTSFVAYSSEVFSDQDFYSFLNDLGIDFMCSYSFSEELQNMIGEDNFICKIITVNRSINCNGNGRVAKEMFFMNYLLIKRRSLTNEI